MPPRLVDRMLVAAVVLGSLAMWTVVPFGWIQLTASLFDGQGARFVVVIAGVPLAMAAMFVLVSRVETHRLTRLGHTPPEPVEGALVQPSWRSALLEKSLVGGAGVALVSLVLWWIFGADNSSPSGPFQPL